MSPKEIADHMLKGRQPGCSCLTCQIARHVAAIHSVETRERIRLSLAEAGVFNCDIRADAMILYLSPAEARHLASLAPGAPALVVRPAKLPNQPTFRGGWEATTVGGDGVFADGSPVPEMVAIWNQTTGKTIASPFQPGDRVPCKESFALLGWDGFARLPKEERCVP